ncbi:hypothetical protein [Bacillus altitudinis]|nr:hypothetical protein [Bacillus altitudinis]
MGEKGFVDVDKMMRRGRIEEKIDEMVERKERLNDEIMESERWIREV